jgi:CH-like domain in sperm protein
MEGWLSELGISYKSLENDFSNGYILGSILYRYNLQEDFGTFSTKSNYAGSNLSKVQISLERLGIKFNTNKVLSKETGYINKILSQLYKSLHSISYSNLRSVRGKSAISMPRATKYEIIENNLKKFEEVRLNQSNKALNDEKKQLEAIRQNYLDERKKQIDILKANKIFMQQWDSDGKKDWKDNQMRKTARVKHEENIITKIQSQKFQKQLSYNSEHSNQVVDGIKEFEKNMVRLGIDHAPDAKDIKKKKIDIKTESLVTMAKIVERKIINAQSIKEREVRQRNLVIEHKKNEKFDNYKKSSIKIIAALVKVVSKQYLIGFRNIKKYSNRILNYKVSLKNTEDIMTKNELTWGEIEGKRRQAIASDEIIRKKNLPQEKERIQKNILELRRNSIKQHTEVCLPILELIIQISEETSSYLSYNQKIPEKVWNNWLSLFKNNHSPTFKENIILEETNDNYKEVISDTFYYTPSFSIEKVEEYLLTKGNWKHKECSNNYILGDILEIIIPIAYPDDPDPPLPEGPNYLPLKVILIGPGFAGKKTQTKKLQESYGLKLIEVPKILEDARKVIQRKNEPDDPKKKKPVEEEPEVFTSICNETLGEDELGRSKLIRARLRSIFGDFQKLEEEVKKQGKKDEAKCLGYVMVGYPNTVQEAADLERHMSGFVHPSELPEPLSIVKKREALIIAQPSVKPPPPKKLHRSAFDLVIVLDVDVAVCVTRAVDRRIDPGGNIYNLTYNPPPDNILAKCKPIEHPNQEEVQEMHQTYSNSRETLLHWYSQFGTQDQPALLVVKSNHSIESASEIIKTRISNILKTKHSNQATPAASQRGPNLINLQQALDLSGDWEKLKKEYLSQLSYSLCHLEIHLKTYNSILENKKNEFLKLLTSPDEKPDLFYNFRDNLAQTIQSKKFFTSAELRKLNQDIEELSDQIWDVINHKKERAIAKRQEIIDGSILTQQIAGILHLCMNLMNTEIKKYYSVMNLIDKYYCYLENTEYTAKTPGFLEINWKDWDGKLINIPLLEYLRSTAKKSIINTPDHSLETSIFLNRLENIYNFGVSTINTYTEISNKLFSVLDTSIIFSVQQENENLSTMVIAI